MKEKRNGLFSKFVAKFENILCKCVNIQTSNSIVSKGVANMREIWPFYKTAPKAKWLKFVFLKQEKGKEKVQIGKLINFYPSSTRDHKEFNEHILNNI